MKLLYPPNITNQRAQFCRNQLLDTVMVASDSHTESSNNWEQSTLLHSGLEVSHMDTSWMPKYLRMLSSYEQATIILIGYPYLSLENVKGKTSMNSEITNQALYWLISAWLKMNKDVEVGDRMCIFTYLQVIPLGHRCQSDTGVQVQTCHLRGCPQSPGIGKRKGEWSLTVIYPCKKQDVQHTEQQKHPKNLMTHTVTTKRLMYKHINQNQSGLVAFLYSARHQC